MANADRAQLEHLAATLEAVRALQPESANTLPLLAEVRSGLGDNGESLKLPTRTVELDPSVRSGGRAGEQGCGDAPSSPRSLLNV